MDVLQALRRHGGPEGARVEVLVKATGLTENQVRARIGSARAKGINIQNVAFRTFQLRKGPYRSKRDRR